MNRINNVKVLQIFLCILITITLIKEVFPKSKLCLIKTEPLSFIVEFQPEPVPTPEMFITPYGF